MGKIRNNEFHNYKKFIYFCVIVMYLIRFIDIRVAMFLHHFTMNLLKNLYFYMMFCTGVFNSPMMVIILL
jgi:hypothetical protein